MEPDNDIRPFKRRRRENGLALGLVEDNATVDQEFELIQVNGGLNLKVYKASSKEQSDFSRPSVTIHTEDFLNLPAVAPPVSESAPPISSALPPSPPPSQSPPPSPRLSPIPEEFAFPAVEDEEIPSSTSSSAQPPSLRKHAEERRILRQRVKEQAETEEKERVPNVDVLSSVLRGSKEESDSSSSLPPEMARSRPSSPPPSSPPRIAFSLHSLLLSDFERMSDPDLKSALRDRGLPVHGSRAELIQRLEQDAKETNSKEKKKRKDSPRKARSSPKKGSAPSTPSKVDSKNSSPSKLAPPPEWLSWD